MKNPGTLPKFFLGLAQVILIGLCSWILLSTHQNSVDIAVLKAQMAVIQSQIGQRYAQSPPTARTGKP